MEDPYNEAVSQWLTQAPEDGLLEVDIKEGSFNLMPWVGQHVDDATSYRSSRVALQSDEANPFSGLHIADSSDLAKIHQRSLCSRCQKSRKFYCYTCYIPLPETASLIPKIAKLPLRVEIIKHPQELDGKSTAVHAAVLCPSHVRISIYPDVPWEDIAEKSVLLVFPGPDALDISTAFQTGTEGQLKVNPQKYDRVLFVDCTWHQVKSIISDTRLAHLSKVMLTNRRTLFWRSQKGKPDQYLATIEAIYYFMHDYQTDVLKEPYQGEFDNLLFLYKFMHGKLHKVYR